MNLFNPNKVKTTSRKVMMLTFFLLVSTLSFPNITRANPSIDGINITVSGATGNAGTYIVGDTLTVLWDSEADGNIIGSITSATVDVSDWGGPTNLAMTDTTACGGIPDNGFFEACYEVLPGNIDAGAINQRVTITATDIGGSTGPVFDDEDSTVDNKLPVLFFVPFLIVEDNGVAGVAGLNYGLVNPDSIGLEDGVAEVADPDDDVLTWDATPIGGNAAQDLSDVVVIQAGNIDDAAFGFDFTITDDAGNTVVTNSADVALPGTLSIDNEAPAPSLSCISVTGATGTGGAFKNGDSPIATWNDNNPGLGCTDNYGDIDSIEFDASDFKAVDTALAGSVSSNVWTASLSGVMDAQDDSNNNITITALDDAGNGGTTTGTNDYTIDSIAPSINDNGTLTISTDNGTTDQVGVNGGLEDPDQVTQSNAVVAAADGDTTSINLTALTGQATVAGGVESGDVIAGALDDPAQTFTITVTDNAGNTTTTDSDPLDVDNILPILAEVTPVPDPTTDPTPDYTFSSTEAGELTFDACGSVTDAALVGSNTITLTSSLGPPFALATIDSCTLTVTDDAGNVSEILEVSPFTVEEVDTPEPDEPSPTPQPQSSGGGGGGGGGGYKAGDPCVGLTSSECKKKAKPQTITNEQAGAESNSDDEEVKAPVSCERKVPLPFEDMIGHSAMEAVDNLYYRCAISGKTATIFSPNAGITRGELAKIVVILFRLPYENIQVDNPFEDVKTTSWYAKFIQAGKNAGLLEGYSNGFYYPDSTASLAETLKLLIKAANLKESEASDVPFKNIDEKDWFYAYVVEAWKKGLIKAGEVDFARAVPRSEVSQMLSILIKMVESERGSEAIAGYSK